MNIWNICCSILPSLQKLFLHNLYALALYGAVSPKRAGI